MDTLFTIAVPRLAADDARWIEQFRAVHDRAAAAPVPPHFTLLFGCDAVPEAGYVTHVEAVVARHRAFRFACRHAMVFPGPADSYVYLVPDEGLSALARLRDDLSNGVMEPHVRRDLPFIPHITIASGQAPQRAHALCRELNASGLAVAGRVDALAVGALRAGVFVERAIVPLCGDCDA